jgi:hypothetical protein
MVRSSASAYSYSGRRWKEVITAGLCILLLVGCGSRGGTVDIAWQPYQEARPTPPASSATAVSMTPDPSPSETTFSRRLSKEDLQTYQPDELGLVPIPMYHAFVPDHATKEGQGSGDSLDEWTRTLSEFRADLQWYYDRDFYVIPMRDYVENNIRVPPGKHPIVLTFDDASTRQAMWTKNDQGKIVADPESALGVMEDFFTRHPDFGRGGYFAVLLFNCFNNPDGPEEMADCATKLTWLVDHGYEIGNHTDGHQDLTDIPDDEFLYQIGHPILWFEENIPASGNLSNVLTLPFGAYPDRDLHQQQWDYLVDGFDYHGERIDLEGILQVNGGPAPSPSSTSFDRYGIARYNTDPEVLAYWQQRIDDGEIVLYTSDGNPDTVTVPKPIPDALAGDYDADAIEASGKTIVRYKPTSTPTSAPSATPPVIGTPAPIPDATPDRKTTAGVVPPIEIAAIDRHGVAYRKGRDDRKNLNLAIL